MGQNKQLIYLLTSVLLLTLSFPPFGLNFLGWFALVPFYCIILTNKHKVKIGLVYGLVFGSLLYGLMYVSVYKGNPLKFLGTTSIILFQGIFYATHGYFISLIQRYVDKKTGQIVMIVLNWIVLEFVGNRLFLGFSMYGALAQYRNFSLLYFAQYIGVYGIGGLVILVNLLVATTYLAITEKGWRKKNFYIIESVLVVVFLVIMGFEIINMQTFTEVNGGAENVKIVLIQGNITDPEYKLADRNIEIASEQFVKYLNLSERSLEDGSPDLIVWPETAVHRYMLRIPEYRDQLYQFARENKVSLLIGSPDWSIDHKKYNSVFLISPEGELVGKYDKTILFPFIEKSFSVPEKPNNLFDWRGRKLGINICFETNFPEISAKLVRDGADFLYVLSNNGVFGLTRIPYFTTAFSIFRAAENQIYVIQAMNTGISQIVAPGGRVLKQTKLFTEDVVTYQLPMLKASPTLYSQYGHVFYPGLTVLYLVTILYFYFKQKIKINKEE